MIYMDNAATTALDSRVLEKMMPYMTQLYGNPSSVYRLGVKSRNAIDAARHEAADLIGAKDNEIYFTAGGSESDNWALKAASEMGKRHIITTRVEHHAVIHTAQYLERSGIDVTFLDVDEYGMVNPLDVKKAIRPDTALVSVMFANNEVGTLQPINEIGKICREKNVLFHTDAVQAYGHVPINVDECCIDMLSASGHKLNGPKGVGILYIRDGIKIGSFIHGGSQERSRRAGTSNVPGIVGFGEAARLAAETMKERMEHEITIRDYMIKRIEREIPFVMLNGHRQNRLPNNVSFCFRFVQGESILIMLDMKDIYVSSGSACTSGSIDPSHVLLAMGRSRDDAYGAVRMTLSEHTTKEEADIVIDELKNIIGRLRRMSPGYAAFIRGRR